jgi:DNA-directed RNA polymerase subunit RPC12/RpoP
MAECATCGNEYDQPLKITVGGKTWQFDCFECAIHKLAPDCEHCGVKVIGKGVEAGETTKRIFCCAHCARESGIEGLQMHVDPDGGRRQPGH